MGWTARSLVVLGLSVAANFRNERQRKAPWVMAFLVTCMCYWQFLAGCAVPGGAKKQADGSYTPRPGRRVSGLPVAWPALVGRVHSGRTRLLLRKNILEGSISCRPLGGARQCRRHEAARPARSRWAAVSNASCWAVEDWAKRRSSRVASRAPKKRQLRWPKVVEARDSRGFDRLIGTAGRVGGAGDARPMVPCASAHCGAVPTPPALRSSGAGPVHFLTLAALRGERDPGLLSSGF